MKRYLGTVMWAAAFFAAVLSGCGRPEHPRESGEASAEQSREGGDENSGQGREDGDTDPEQSRESDAAAAGPGESGDAPGPERPGQRQGEGSAIAEPLPDSYDGREAHRTAPVKDQGDLGTCWAFASVMSLENKLLPEESWDFSEDHMSHNPNFALGQENGGEYTMSMAYLLSWQGPVTEEQDPYGDGVSPDGLQAVKHVQEIQLLPAGDRDQIKRAVMEHGGVQSSLYTTLKNGASSSEYYNRDTKSYCCPKEHAPNHDVVIVGWDDSFPKESFPVEVPEDGAFLCENSWGAQFGEDGFFYVSYCDANLGKNNVVYSRVEEPDNYSRIYQSDLCGWIGQLGYGSDTVWAANVYQAERAENLGAVGFYAIDQDTDYEVYMVHRVPEKPDDEDFSGRIKVAEGHLEHAGFYTIQLRETEKLERGERFAVMIRLTTPGAIHPIAIEYDAGDGKCRIDLRDGEGYISLEGNHWEHVEESQKCNICLKAYTTGR